MLWSSNTKKHILSCLSSAFFLLAIADTIASDFTDIQLSLDEADNVKSNAVFWGSTLTGGIEHHSNNQSSDRFSSGLFVNADSEQSSLGAIFGMNIEDVEEGTNRELQTQLQLNNTLSIGAGHTEYSNGAPSISFFKTVHRASVGNFELQLSPIIEKLGGETDWGGYASVHDDILFVGGGFDEAHWRLLTSFTAPPSSLEVRPVGEVVD